MAKEKYFREAGDEIHFNLINREMLEFWESDGRIKLPRKRLDIPKDRLWNQKFIHSQIYKGILAGDSIPKLAARIFPEMVSKEGFIGAETLKDISGIIKRNQESAVRNARTMVTSAENGGRLSSYKNLAAQGVVQKKVWVATPDDRTRPSHIDIDGEEQDIDKEFSNRCMYPADPAGPAEEVWMCRCSMHTHIIGFKGAGGKISYVKGGRDKTLHDTQMKAEKRRRKKEARNGRKQ